MDAEAVDPVPVHVVHVDNPSKFYVRPRTMERSYELFLRDLQKDLDENWEHRQMDRPAWELSYREGLLVRHQTYIKRATRLRDDLNSEQKGTFFLIDEGKVVLVNYDRCYKPASHDLMSHDKFALRCHLADVVSAGPLPNEWQSEEPKTFFKTCLAENPAVGLIPRRDVELRPDGQKSRGVDLCFIEEMNEGEFPNTRIKQVTSYLSLKLIKAGLAVYRDTLPEEEQTMNESGETEDDIGPEDAVNVSESGSETDFDDGNIVHKWQRPIVPTEVGVPLRVVVTYLDNYGQIYAHAYEDRGKLREMREYYMLLYGSEEGGRAAKADWSDGEACVARFTDGRWYRAVVEDVADLRARVLFVDWGDTLIVEDVRADLRVAFHFEDVPILCLRFVMDGVNLGARKGGMSRSEYEDIFLTLHQNPVKVTQTQTVDKLPVPVTVEIKDKDMRVWIDCAKRFVRILGLARFGTPEFGDQELNEAGGWIVGDFGRSSEVVRGPEVPRTPCPWALPKRTFVRGELVQVKVEVCDDDGQAAVHVVQRGGHCTFDSVHQAMQRLSVHQPPAVVAEGNKVAVKWRGVWYRAYILSEDSPAGKVTVHLVDAEMWLKVGGDSLRQLAPQADAMPLVTFKVQTGYAREKMNRFQEILRGVAQCQTELFVLITQGSVKSNVMLGEFVVKPSENRPVSVFDCF